MREYLAYFITNQSLGCLIFGLWRLLTGESAVVRGSVLQRVAVL